MFGLRAAIVASAIFARVAQAQTVFAHFMLQNAYSYVQSDWTVDMKAAQAIGIDGFALNIAIDSGNYETGKMIDAYAAAEPLGFKLWISFDMSYDWAEADMVSLVSAHANSSAAYQWNGKPLVSTFDGEAKGDSFWTSFKSTLSSSGIDIVFVPAFNSYTQASQASDLVSTFSSIDGFFNWQAWPTVNSTLTTAADLAFQSAVYSRGGPYIMAVSPWQFKNLAGQDWVQLADTLWNYRWQQAIHDVKPDIIEIITWNDYGESHYISDINPLVNLGDVIPIYVDGFDHGPWRDVAKYYIDYYKTNSTPTITADEVVYWYRAFPKDITCSTGTLPSNAAFPADAVFALAMLTAPANVTLTIGSETTVFYAEAGLTMGSVAFPTEDKQTPTVEINRAGTKIASGTGGISVNQTGCTYYNFNPYVGSVIAK